MTDHEIFMETLAKRGRRYEVQVSPSESRIIDYGVYNGRNAWKPTRFVFDGDGTFVYTNRPHKAWWLTRPVVGDTWCVSRKYHPRSCAFWGRKHRVSRSTFFVFALESRSRRMLGLWCKAFLLPEAK